MSWPTQIVVRPSADLDVDYEALSARVNLAATPAAWEECLTEIGRALGSVTAPVGRGRLLLDRARVRSHQSRTAQACEDAKAAMALFEAAGETELAIDAASLGAAHAARVGELSLASELARKSILALGSVTDDDHIRAEIANRLGSFCSSCLDYDRAVEQFEISLAAAVRTGDRDKVNRQLYNIADALLLLYRGRRSAHLGTGTGPLERAEVTVRRLLAEGTEEVNHRLGSHRLLAQVLCELGRADEALRVLEESRHETSALTHTAARTALALVEARCLRLAGRTDEAVASARRAVGLTDTNSAEQVMLTFEELSACEEAAGDLKSALAHAREARARMWSIHQRQTKQFVQEVWERADLELDRSRLRAQAARATQSAEEDDLTSVGNRRLLERFLGEGPVRQGEVAFILADVDCFKEINDTLGHHVGDAVLRRLGQLFLGEMRSGQVAVRYGGDEFVLALPGVDLLAAYGFAERLRLAVLGHDWEALAPGLQVTVSIGLACGPASDWQAVIAAADTPLYAAKQRGRNTVVTTSIGYPHSVVQSQLAVGP